MSRYFFHVFNGKADIDTIGTDCADLPSMRTQAIRSAGEMLSTGEQSWSGDAWRMVVTDSDERIVFGMSFTVDRHSL